MIFNKVNNISVVCFLPGTLHVGGVFCSKATAADKFMVVKQLNPSQSWIELHCSSLHFFYTENEPQRRISCPFHHCSTTFPHLGKRKMTSVIMLHKQEKAILQKPTRGHVITLSHTTWCLSSSYTRGGSQEGCTYLSSPWRHQRAIKQCNYEINKLWSAGLCFQRLFYGTQLDTVLLMSLSGLLKSFFFACCACASAVPSIVIVTCGSLAASTLSDTLLLSSHNDVNGVHREDID